MALQRLLLFALGGGVVYASSSAILSLSASYARCVCFFSLLRSQSLEFCSPCLEQGQCQGTDLLDTSYEMAMAAATLLARKGSGGIAARGTFRIFLV